MTEQENRIKELEYQQTLLLTTITRLLQSLGHIREDIVMLSGPEALFFASDIVDIKDLLKE